MFFPSLYVYAICNDLPFMVKTFDPDVEEVLTWALSSLWDGQEAHPQAGCLLLFPLIYLSTACVSTCDTLYAVYFRISSSKISGIGSHTSLPTVCISASAACDLMTLASEGIERAEDEPRSGLHLSSTGEVVVCVEVTYDLFKKPTHLLL